MGDALFDEAMGPVADRRFGDAKDGLLSFADPEAPGRYAVSGKEGQDRAGSSPLVAVVEVIGSGIVEIHGFFDEAQPERADIEAEIATRGTGDRGHMMNSSVQHPSQSGNRGNTLVGVLNHVATVFINPRRCGIRTGTAGTVPRPEIIAHIWRKGRKKS